MRRNHWWGVTLGAGVVAAAAFLAPSALAASAAAPFSHPAPKIVAKNSSVTAFGRIQARGRDDHSDHGCHYPPSASPNVVISGVSRAGRHGYNVNGSAKLNTCGYSHKTAGLYQWHKGSGKGSGAGWDEVSQTSTDDKGDFSFPFSPQGQDKVLLRVAVVGADGYGAAQSDVFKLEAHDYR